MKFHRDLLRGSLELLVLSDLQQGERYGYQILTSLRKRSLGRVELKAGTLYPILHKLERDGCVRPRWEKSTGRDRKFYELTDAGRRELSRATAEWIDYSETVRRVLGAEFGPGAVEPAGG